MKNLNFLSNQSDFGLENGSGMTREWLGIDSTVSRKLFTLLFVLLLGVGQMWAKEGDVLKTYNTNSSTFTTGYKRQSGDNFVWWGQKNYYGANSATNHGNNKPTAADLPVVKAQNASATTSTTGLYYCYTSEAVANVGALEITFSDKSGSSTVNAYIVTSSTAASSGSATWTKVTLSASSANAQGKNVASSNTYRFTFNATETGAKYYGVVFATSSYWRATGFQMKLIEGATSSKTLSSISVQTAPTKVKYVAGENFDPTGLIITRNYSSGSPDTYTYASHTSEFSFTPSTSTALTTSNTSVSITYGGKSVSQSINVYNVTMQARDEDGNTIPAGGPGAPSRTGKSITPAADANNYVFKEWSISGASLGSSKTTKSNTITNPTGAVTVTAVYYKPIPVSWNKNGSLHATTYTGYNQKPVFPANPSSCDATSNTFYGWATGTWENTVDNLTGKTVYTSADGMPNVTAAGTVYNAVFAKATDSSTPASFTSTFTSKSWGDSNSLWNSGKDGNALQSGRGVQITTGSTGANATTKSSYSNVTSVVVTYSTNASAGAGTISITVGGTSTTASATVSTSGGTTDRTITYTPTSPATSLTGNVKITATCSTNSIYIKSVQVNYSTGGTTYSKYRTLCCTELVSINGSFNQGQQKVTWSAVTDASGYKVRVEDANHQQVLDWTDINNVLEYPTSGLTCGGATYYVYVKAYNNDNAGHCTGDGPACEAIQVTSAACTEPALAADPTSLTGLSYIVGAGPSAAQSFSISGTNLENGSLTITAPTNYEVSKTSATTGFANSVSVNANGTLSATDIWVRLKANKAVGNYNNETVSISGCGLASAATVTVSGSVLKPTITATPTSISDWSTQTGTAPSPATKTITVTGVNLKANISASLTAGGDYFTITPSGLTPTSGSVNNGSVVISVKAAAYASAATREGTLLLTTTDGDNVEVNFSLTVSDDPREKFTLLTSSNVGEIGDGTRLVIVESDRTYAMNRTQDGTNGHGYIGSTNQFSFQSENTIITLEVSNSVEILTLEEISDGVYALKTESTSKYLKWNGGSNNKFSEVDTYSDANAKWTIDVDGDGHAQISANSGVGYYIGYNNTPSMTSRFRAYSDNSTYPIFAYFKASTTPKVNISGTMNAFTYMRDNGPSAAQSFKVSGNNLSENLVVTAPTNYEVCKTENGTYTATVEFEPAAGSVAQSDVYIRLKASLAINTYNGDITVSSTGATNATKAVTGSVTTPVYTVTLNTNGGTIEDGHDVTSYTEGVGATLPTAEYISKSGFSFGGWYANSDLETGGVQTTIATNATGAKEYWAKWTELPGYDITWLVDGEAYTGGEPDVHVVYNGSISKLPSTPTSLDITSKTFVGWTTDPVNEKQANAPTPLYTAANQIPGNITENKIFYAVFAQEVLSGTFTKVTNDATLAAGDRLLIVNESDNKAAGTLGSNSYLSIESVIRTNSEISDKGNASVFTLGGTSGAWTLTSAEGTLGCTGTSNNSLSKSGGTTTWEITINGNATIKPTDLVTYIKYNSGNRFSSYASYGSQVQLYREGTSLNDYTTKFVKPVAVTGVTLNKNATTLAIGGTETLTATVAPANATNKNVSWSSNTPGVATVEAGVVTAVSAGEATITVTTEDGSKTDACVVTVLPTVATPTFSPAAGAINKGSKVEILCATEDATILYSLDGSDPSVAYPEGGVAINANCTLKAKATKANYTTSAVAEAAYTIIKATQTVSFAESAISFRLESDEYNAFTGQTASSTYGSAVITYASSNTSVAEVNTNTGVVTLKGVKGTTTITATAAEDEDYQSDSETYTITVLRAGKTRTGDFKLVTNANQLEDGDYILLASPTKTGYNDNPDYAYVLSGISTSSATYQSKDVVNDEITYSQFLTEGNTAKIIYLEKVTVDNIDYWAFNYGTDADLYLSAGTSTSAHDLSSESTISDKEKWTIAIDATTHVATVLNVSNTSAGKLLCNNSNNQFRSFSNNSTAGSLRIYKQKDKNKLPQTLSFVTPSYEFPLNESAYTSFSHQTVSGAHTAVTYTSNNDAVAVINNNTVVLNGGVGTATITATAAEDDDYEHASATYTITVTAALNTVTFHYYKPADATADQTALKEASSGAGITVPANPANVGEYTFLGWAPATLVETQTAPDNLVALQAGATYHPATSEEYHAIYRRLENSDGRFYLMHEVSSVPNYAKAPVGTDTKSFGNTTSIEDAAVFVQTGDNKLYYDNNGTPRYVSSTNKSERDLDFTTNAADAKVWTITESGTTTTFYSSNSEKYLAHNGNMWAAYGTGSINQANQSKDLKKVYLAHVYYSSTPNLMVSPVLTWAQGNETHVMEIEATYDNAATATVNDVPVSVTYSSSDETKATVDNAGVVTAHLGGLVTITATVAENPGVSRQLVETYQVSITKKVPQIVFNDGANWVVYVGEAYKRVLADNVEVTTDGAITYTLSNNATSSDYASINTNTGEVTGLYSNGSAIQAFWVHTEETDMYQAGAANHQFQVWSLKPQTLTFDQAAYAFEMNESVAAFTNTLSGAQTTVTYISDNTDVAEIDSESGEVTVHTNVCGTATITATAAEGQAGELIYREVSQTYTITVNYPMPTFSMESSNIKAPVSLTISGYDENTKLYWTDGNEDPETLYSEPLAISATKTIRAKATNADGSLVSPIASVTLTKVTPTVTGTQDGGTITLNSDENSLITYIIENGNHVIVASGEDVPTPVVFETDMSDTYSVVAQAAWNVEGGFIGSEYEHDFVVKAKGHLPISYNGNGSGLAEKDWASIVGTLGNYGNDPKIQFKNEGCALIAAFVEQPVQLSYDIKHMAANNNAWETTSNVYSVQWSADGETYNDIVVYNASHPISKDEITSESFELNPSARYIKWTYNTKTQSIGGNVALGNIRITCEAVVIDGVTIVDIPEGYDGDVVVEEGAKWIPVNNDFMPVVNNLWVKQGAVVDLSMAMLEVNDLRIEAMEGYSGQILDQDNFSITGNAYYDLTLNTSGTMDNSKWYAFAVPFQVDAATGIQRLSNKGVASNAGFNSHYVLLKYNSEAYASSGQGWKYVTRGETLMPGKFYMIALNSNEYNRVRMTKKAGTPVNNKANLTLSTVGTGEHANWNALANNALAYVNVNATGGNASLKVQVYSSATDSYDPLAYDEVTFTVGTPFFVQAVEAGTMSVEIATSNNETVKAPAREAVATGEFKIRLGADTESYYDQLYVSASDEALNEYQIGHDLAKAGVSTSVPQLYVPAYGAKLCDAEFPLVNNEATFPLTFTAPNAGTYQLYISKAATDAELFLTKDGSVIWNLSMGAYALTLEKGTTENYGLLLKAAKTPTGIESISDEGLEIRGAQKIVLEDKVFILRGGKMYDVTGKMVK